VTEEKKRHHPGSRGYPTRVIERARDLFCFQGLNDTEITAQINEEFGIEVHRTTIRNWANRKRWSKFSRELEALKDQTPFKMLQLFDNLLDACTEGADWQKVNQTIRLGDMLGMFDFSKDRQEKADLEADMPRIFLENLRFIISVLKERDPSALKGLERNFDILINAFKDRHNEKTA